MVNNSKVINPQKFLKKQLNHKNKINLPLKEKDLNQFSRNQLLQTRKAPNNDNQQNFLNNYSCSTFVVLYHHHPFIYYST